MVRVGEDDIGCASDVEDFAVWENEFVDPVAKFAGQFDEQRLAVVDVALRAIRLEALP